MFQSLRVRFFWLFYGIMFVSLTFLSGITYIGISKILYGQLDKKLETLADLILQNNQLLISPNSSEDPVVSHLPREVGLEWFNEQHHLILDQGSVLASSEPRPGISVEKVEENSQGHYYIRSFTLKVSIDRSELQQPPIEGYLRLNHSTQSLEATRREIFFFLLMTVTSILAVLGGVGFWLMQEVVKPVEETVKKLRQFTNDASHELRTPLTSIQTCTDRLLKRPNRFEPKDVQKLRIIDRATKRMIDLVEDLLFLARNDRNLLQENQSISIIDLKPLLEDLIELLEPLAHEKQITLQTIFKTNSKLQGDQQQISRLLINIIENAIKYTPDKGKVTIYLVKNTRYSVILVQDTGIGIPKAEVSKVFDRFWRADQSRQEKGTGLGLSIAQAIAQRHGGKIEIESELGQGTCFKIYLPCF